MTSYPAIIDPASFDAVSAELTKRSTKLGRNDRYIAPIIKRPPTAFRLGDITENYELDCLKYIRQLKDKNIPVSSKRKPSTLWMPRVRSWLRLWLPWLSRNHNPQPECEAGTPVSLPEWPSTGKSQSLPRLHQGCRWESHHRSGTGRSGKANLPGIPRWILDGSDCKRSGSRRILTGAGKTKWWTSTINKILRNENTSVMLFLQKTYTTDFLNKTRVKNNGIVPILCGRQPRSNYSGRIFSYGCRKSWYADEWSKPVPMAKSAPTVAATTALHRLSFAANAVKCSAESTGTIAAENPSSGVHQ